MKRSATAPLIVCWLISVLSCGAFIEDPQQVGDLVYRKSHDKIFGEHGVQDCDYLTPPILLGEGVYVGHVGIYTGSRQIIHALGWESFGLPITGFVVETPLDPLKNTLTFYEDSDQQDGVRDHVALGAKAHIRLKDNPDAKRLRDNIILLARDQLGEGYDNGGGQQKGLGPNDWTCSGFVEKVYESCNSANLLKPEPYGDQSPYEGGLNITRDGVAWVADSFSCNFQTLVEFTQLPELSGAIWGRAFRQGLVTHYFAFFPYTQYQQPTLTDSFAPRDPPPEISVTVFANAHGMVTPSGTLLVAAGTSVQLQALPDPGYFIEAWTVDGVSKQLGGTQFTLTDVRTPYVISVTFTDGLPRAGDHLTLCGLKWDDSDGDRDGVAETREDLRLTPSLRSSQAATQIEAVLVSTDATVQILSGSRYLDALPSASCLPTSSSFRLRIDSDTSTASRFVLRVTYTIGTDHFFQDLPFDVSLPTNGSVSARFTMTATSTRDAIELSPRNDGNGIVTSGERFDLRASVLNTGTATATGLNIRLTSPAPGVQVREEPITYPDLPPQAAAQALSDRAWRVEVPPSFSGTLCLDALIAWDQNLAGVTQRCSLNVPAAPTPWLYPDKEAYSFGTSTRGDTVQQTVILRNVGSAPLHVTGVQLPAADTTCPTLTASPLPWVIAPGATKDVLLQLVTTDLTGTVSREIRLESDSRLVRDGSNARFVIEGFVSDLVPVGRVPTSGSLGDPDIEGSRIVWSASQDQLSEVFLFDLLDGSTVKLSKSSTHSTQPRISGSLVVWTDWRNDPAATGENTDLYGIDLAKPELGPFPISTDASPEELLGVSDNLIAVRRRFWRTGERGTPSAWNLVVYRYEGDRRVTIVYATTFSANDNHQPVETVDGGDFREGFLAVTRYQVFWDTSVTNPYWNRRNGRVEAVDYLAGETSLRVVTGLPSASDLAPIQHGVVFSQSDRSGDSQVYMYRRSNDSIQQLTNIPDLDAGEGGRLAASGPVDQSLIVYGYRARSKRPGLYYMDRSLSDTEAGLSLSADVGPGDLRVSGGSVVWKTPLPTIGLWYANLRSGDPALNSDDLVPTTNVVIRGQPLALQVIVRNLAAITIREPVRVSIYEGDPAATGRLLGEKVTATAGIPGRGSETLSFAGLTLAGEGTHQIFVRLHASFVQVRDNDTARILIDVVNPDDTGPTVVDFIAAESDGDGDGIPATDESLIFSWRCADPSGVAAVRATVNGADLIVERSGERFSAKVGPMGATGPHRVTIVATDGDTTPSSSTNSFTLDPLSAAEELNILYGQQPIAPEALVDLGSFTRGEAAGRALVVRNSGQQRLDRLAAAVLAGPIVASLATNPVAPGRATVLALKPSTEAAGEFFSQIAVTSSDPRNPRFLVRTRHQVQESSGAQRSFSSICLSNRNPVTVVIDVAPPAGTRLFVLEDNPPLGMSVAAVGQDGSLAGRVVRWIFADGLPHKVSYTVVPGDLSVSTGVFSGRVAFDASGEKDIGGQASIERCDFVPSLRATVTSLLGQRFIQVTLRGRSGSRCRIQSAERLDAVGKWTDRATIQLDSDQTDWTDAQPITGNERYYRVLILE